jgi:hypothetical protein
MSKWVNGVVLDAPADVGYYPQSDCGCDTPMGRNVP